jgi:hypothetical protein
MKVLVDEDSEIDAMVIEDAGIVPHVGETLSYQAADGSKTSFKVLRRDFHYADGGTTVEVHAAPVRGDSESLFAFGP